MSPLRILVLLSLLLPALSAVAQRPKTTKATVFTDMNGRVLSWKAYQGKLRSDSFVVDRAQVSRGLITAISLRPAAAPDAVRTQATSPLRTYRTAAPTFELTDLNGRSYSLAALRGKVVVLNFWFIKCAYCQLEMPELRQLTADYGANPNVVFISLAREEAAKLRRYVADKGDFGFAIVPLPPGLASRYGIAGYPTTVVLDRQGQFAYDKEGYAGNLLRLREAIDLALR